MLYPEYWNINKFNNRIDLSLEHKYKVNEISGEIELSTMSSALFSDYNYNKFILENINNASIFDLKAKIKNICTNRNW